MFLLAFPSHSFTHSQESCMDLTEAEEESCCCTHIMGRHHINKVKITTDAAKVDKAC